MSEGGDVKGEMSRTRGGVTNWPVHADVYSTLRRLVALTTELTSATAAEAERLSGVYSTYRPVLSESVDLMWSSLQHTLSRQLPSSPAAAAAAAAAAVNTFNCLTESPRQQRNFTVANKNNQSAKTNCLKTDDSSSRRDVNQLG